MIEFAAKSKVQIDKIDFIAQLNWLVLCTFYLLRNIRVSDILFTIPTIWFRLLPILNVNLNLLALKYLICNKIHYVLSVMCSSPTKLKLRHHLLVFGIINALQAQSARDSIIFHLELVNWFASIISHHQLKCFVRWRWFCVRLQHCLCCWII